MKSKYLILVFGTLLLFACNMEDDTHVELTEADLIALDGMEEAFESAVLYNDSLHFCSTEPLSCDSTTMLHYDALFHQFDEMFIHHHDNYSHNNNDDDHHHEAGNMIHHGGMTHHDDDEHDEYEHNDETYDMMRELREMHEGIHPG